MLDSEKNKYDSPLELGQKNTLSVILKGINPDSIILEFGPASGRMTKYMKEELHCEVYIVEIDDVAFDNAVKYAKEGLLGDIMSFEWLRRFSNIRFDYIIFADVLEHLSDPLEVLIKSENLLKECGRIYFSVPNIAYSGVVYELLQDKFQYRKTGILDSTHTHFFTKESILEMVAKASLVPISIDEINNQISNSEFQSDNGLLPRDLKEYLEELDFGHVYQYVFCVVSKSFYEKSSNITKPQEASAYSGVEVPSYLYLDCGHGYNENQKVTVNYHRGKNIKVVFPVSQFKDIITVRWDTVCDRPCTISNIVASCNGIPFKYLSTNAVFIKDDLNVFFDGIAMFNFKNTTKSATEIAFAATVEPMYATDNCKDFMRNITEEHEAAMYYIKLLENKQLSTQNKNINRQKILEEAKQKNQQLIDQISRDSEHIKKIEEENANLRCDNEELSSQVPELVSAVSNLTAEINNFKQSEFWKMTWPARVFVSRLRGFRQRMKMRIANYLQIESNTKLSVETVPQTDKIANQANLEKKTALQEEKALILTPTITEVTERQQYNTIVSVIIPTYNAGEEFKNLLFLLKRQKKIQGIEIIIVDSGSKDHTVGIARFFGAELIEIPQKDFTHSYARNLGAKKANGKFLLFMTQDAMPTDDTWLYRLITPIVGEEIAAATCAETPRADADLAYRVNMWYHYRFLEISNKDRICSMPESSDFTSLRKNGQLSDVTCIIKAFVFKKYMYSGCYAEDLDLGIKLIKDGYKIAFLSSVKVIHSHNRSCGYYLKRAFVDKKALIGILPDFPVAKTDYADIISAILNGYVQTCAFLNLIEKEEKKSEHADTFFGKIKAFYQLSTDTDFSEIAYGYDYSDEATDSFISSVQKLSHNIAVTGASLFTNVCEFNESCFKPYIVQNYDIIAPALKHEIEVGIFKRFATNVGDAMADYSILNQSNDELNVLAEGLNSNI